MEAAASIIAFVQISTEIGKCIIKTKKLWDQAQDLPQETQLLLTRLQGYKSIFEALDQQYPNQQSFNMLPTFSLVQDNLRASMEALELLRQNADYVSSKLEVKTGLKRKLAAVKIAIGKESSDRLITRLNESVTLLSLALQAWSMTITIMTPDLIANQLTKALKNHCESSQSEKKPLIEAQTESKSLYDVTAIDEGQLPRKPKDDAKLNKKYTASRFGRFVMAYATTTGAWQAYLQLPSWLSSSVYELQSTPTGYGWTYNYRVYNLVSSKSDIIQKIKQGDRDGILELFGTRKASPFDKDEYGQSLLYHAAKSKNLDICQLLLSLGLREALVEKPGPYGESPLAPPVLVPSRSHPEKTWLKIAGLFQSYMDEPETSMVLRMFEYHKTCDYGDEYVRIFRQRFLPNYYHGPLIHRLEAFRLGSFHCQDFTTLKVLLAEDRKFTSFDVSESSRTGFSLVHSIAVAFGIRFADEVLPFKRDWIMWYLSPFGDHWSHMVQGVASVATAKDLHTVEKIQPWDVYQVPCWRGTPLISVIGGALCYLSPDISFVHWDNVFQECIQKWASLLQLSGVDLMLYGEQEAANLNKYFRSSFDMSAIEASRNEIRNVMPRGSARMTFRRAERADRERWNKNHWVPIRLLKLKFGQTPGEWQISWAPEFECMANEFWQMVDKGETTMPGSWVDG
ncbi:hypothetical protein FOCG_14065 [Fusarium oxysporum f. sp. radicis-lycopersici 26381]|nr:uncharacterized protein FOBCDRAFT_210689 [Fusarium oxysporum Fo47]EXL43715.1 hypothetical protein FOCG_14065 [Fusarium oxysporum f. sp. radicis-lycopersici 26381]EWZ51676.1 hypothetical protein FOZG_01677 [Fusarium oxysporum Fo47]EWZ51677.1 hypothetical protein FOZG_01677 [Fusarium oxysporum Fo47]EWZ51678.1 hypothetical protein FOZG_01677 [Fusarium oxysporum Fo47]EWZ51679.1 hypothetical protein FOZG_01677 [Fusarium oxysporum Fo47]